VRKSLRKALRGERDIERLIRSAERNPLAVQGTMSSLRRSVSFDNAASTAYTIIDIEAPDRVGLLYDIASAIFDLKLDISIARIATDDRQARDAFYVSDRLGKKIEKPLRLEEIRKTIERVIDAGLDYAAPDENRSDKQIRMSGKSKEKRRVRK
jgi:[protein-PII] uridylyltransferase